MSGRRAGARRRAPTGRVGPALGLVAMLCALAWSGLVAHAQAELPTVGTTVVANGWEVTLHSYSPPLPRSTGGTTVAQVTAGFTVTDLQSRPSACSEDIAIEGTDGQRYPPVSLDQIPGPPRIVRGPGAPTPEPATQRRYCITDVLFEVDPAASVQTLHVVGIAFQLPR